MKAKILALALLALLATAPAADATHNPVASGQTKLELAKPFVQIGGGQVFLREAWAELGAGAYAPELELAPSPPYGGKQGRIPVGTLSLTGAAGGDQPRPAR